MLDLQKKKLLRLSVLIHTIFLSQRSIYFFIVKTTMGKGIFEKTTQKMKILPHRINCMDRNQHYTTVAQGRRNQWK